MTRIIDGQSMTTRAAAHAELARALGFPDWYGGNLDALWDLACGLQADAALIHAPALLNALGAYGCRLLQTLYEAAAENERFSFRLAETADAAQRPHASGTAGDGMPPSGPAENA